MAQSLGLWKSSGKHSYESCSTLWMSLMPWIACLKVDKIVNFMFYHNKKNHQKKYCTILVENYSKLYIPLIYVYKIHNIVMKSGGRAFLNSIKQNYWQDWWQYSKEVQEHRLWLPGFIFQLRLSDLGPVTYLLYLTILIWLIGTIIIAPTS